MELERFKETLLEFLSDVTIISEKVKTMYMHDNDEAWKPGKGPKEAPYGYKVLTDFLLVKVQTSSKVPDRPEPENEEGDTTAIEKPKEEIYNCIVNFKFYTRDYVYHISSTWLDYHAQYLGCIVNCRLERPGENWYRGSDLPDGYFCRETWERIKNRIIRYEMKALSKHITSGRYEKPQADVEVTDKQ